MQKFTVGSELTEVLPLNSRVNLINYGPGYVKGYKKNKLDEFDVIIVVDPLDEPEEGQPILEGKEVMASTEMIEKVTPCFGCKWLDHCGKTYGMKSTDDSCPSFEKEILYCQSCKWFSFCRRQYKIRQKDISCEYFEPHSPEVIESVKIDLRNKHKGASESSIVNWTKLALLKIVYDENGKIEK